MLTLMWASWKYRGKNTQARSERLRETLQGLTDQLSLLGSLPTFSDSHS